ncbi:MAG: peptidoglycan DD-metalloendopeptidase family protein [Bacteroidales bacterium]|nr:peptidoglycan DD-metalloendopeptidase family protein [Candidatus Cacconaster merdequi]
MKKDLPLILAFVLLALPVSAQIDIETQADNTEQPAEPTVIDTLDTKDKFTKILLLSDHTWEYFDIGRPVIDTAGLFDEWDSENLHSYKGHTLAEIPDEVDILLTDDEHPYFAPYMAKVYSKYKMRRSRAHNGVDLPLHVGDTIKAAFDGIVRFTGSSRQTGGYGNLIIIRHPNGLETYYGHLSKVFVEPNETVKAGEIIGLGGNTGRSTGPHLHFETRYHGQSFDPERVFDFETGSIRDTTLTLKKHYFSIYSHYGQTDSESKEASGRVVHRIKSGDTLGSLAVKYGTTVTNICRLNGISSKKVLRIGENIIVR